MNGEDLIVVFNGVFDVKNVVGVILCINSFGGSLV